MERIYNIPLRKEFSKAPRYKKASKSIRAIREFIKKHMKVDEVLIGKYLNLEIWKNGPKNPPSKVSVKVVKEENKARVELVGAPEEIKEEPEKKKGKKEEVKEKLEDKTNKPIDKAEEKPKKDTPKEKIPTAKELAEKKAEKPTSTKTPKAKELKTKK